MIKSEEKGRYWRILVLVLGVLRGGPHGGARPPWLLCVRRGLCWRSRLWRSGGRLCCRSPNFLRLLNEIRLSRHRWSIVGNRHVILFLCWVTIGNARGRKKHMKLEENDEFVERLQEKYSPENRNWHAKECAYGYERHVQSRCTPPLAQLFEPQGATFCLWISSSVILQPLVMNKK